MNTGHSKQTGADSRADQTHADDRDPTASDVPAANEQDIRATGAGDQDASDQNAGEDGSGADASLADEVGRLTAENEKLRDQTLRAIAETENVRRRAERDKADTAKYAVTKLAQDLLDVSDNLRRALDAVPARATEANDDLRTIVEGVSATEQGLMSAFERHGITRISPQGEKFDPNFHQAMMEVPGSGQPAGTVVQVLAPGYVIHGRLLRAAMVAVAAGGDAPQRVDTSA